MLWYYLLKNNSLSKWEYEELTTGFVMARKGKERRIILYNCGATVAAAKSFCALSVTGSPVYDTPMSVNVVGVGAAMIILHADGKGTLYDATLNGYLTGLVFGTISYTVA